jgi:hypothetical protein
MKNMSSSKKKVCIELVALTAAVMPGATPFRRFTTSANDAKVLQALIRPLKDELFTWRWRTHSQGHPVSLAHPNLSARATPKPSESEKWR